MKWKLYGNTTIERENGELCDHGDSEDNLYLFTEGFGWSACMDLCPKIEKGRIPMITNKEDIQTLMSWISSIDSLVRYIWTSYTDEEDENVWRSHNNHDMISAQSLFQKGQPNGNRNQNYLRKSAH